MNPSFFADQDFKDINFSEAGFPAGEYENCTFTNCVLSNADLSHSSFLECSFKGCDLSMAKLLSTAFKEVEFTGCKLLGLKFEGCNPFLMSMRFASCRLDLSSFYQVELKGTSILDCRLIEVDFTEANLSKADLSLSDLSGAIFDRTNLEGADLRSALDFSIDPDKNRIRKAKFSSENLIGLLGKYDIEVE